MSEANRVTRQDVKRINNNEEARYALHAQIIEWWENLPADKKQILREQQTDQLFENLRKQLKDAGIV